MREKDALVTSRNEIFAFVKLAAVDIFLEMNLYLAWFALKVTSEKRDAGGNYKTRRGSICKSWYIIWGRSFKLDNLVSLNFGRFWITEESGYPEQNVDALSLA